MSEPTLSLMPEFPPVSTDAWRALVDKALKGVPFDKKLVTRLYDGIALQPVYTRADLDALGTDPAGLPGFAPYGRGAMLLPQAENGAWDIRQAFAHPCLTTANREILADLECGVSSVLLRLDAAGRAGLDVSVAPELAGVDGLMVATAEDLDTVLAGVMLDICPVALDAGAGAFAAAAMLGEVWDKRGVTGTEARGAFNADPLGALAASGRCPQGLDQALADLAALAADTAARWPGVSAVGLDGRPYSDAGATEVQELACLLATGAAYLRALTAHGLDIDTACGQIAFTVTVGTDQFLAIAKLRALRLAWARLTEACGAAPEARRAPVHAVVADRVLSRRDPWVNMLRVTIAAFAAGVGGADSLTTPAFETALGIPTAFGRRIARNTQVILQEESSLGRVIDPAGGSWYVETLTRQVAEKAWAEFQAIEAAGGMAEALASGFLAGKLAAAWNERRKAVAKRKDALTGVNEFPNLHEGAVSVQAPDLAVLRKGAGLRLKGDGAAASTLAARTRALSRGHEATTIDPLPRHRFAEEFEALRDASDIHMVETGERPAVFLANMGTVAQHTARATYARNFFEAGGVEGITNDGFADAAAAAAAFKDSGLAIACLCGTDAQYEAEAEAWAQALRAAGAAFIFMAGKPGERQGAYDGAGVGGYIFVGCEALDILRATHARLGVAAA